MRIRIFEFDVCWIDGLLDLWFVGLMFVGLMFVGLMFVGLMFVGLMFVGFMVCFGNRLYFVYQ